jgi:hypothetical protein
MIKRITAIIAGGGVMAALLVVLGAAPPAMARCSRNLPVSHNIDSVVMQASQTCGFSYRSVGFWGGGSYDGYHYGTYTKVNGTWSTACADSSCNAGNVQWGGYQVKRTSKIVCTFGCAARITTTALVRHQRRSSVGPLVIRTHSGPRYCLAVVPNRAGTVIVQSDDQSTPTCRNFWWSRVAKTRGGYSYGNLTTASGLTQLGADCADSVAKLNRKGSDGTGWVIFKGITGKTFLSPPHCEGGLGHSDCQKVLAADGTLHDPWLIGTLGDGLYENLDGLPGGLDAEHYGTHYIVIDGKRCCVC